MNLSNNVQNLKKSGTKELVSRVNELKSKGVSVIDFGHGEPFTQLEASTLEIISSELSKGNYGYSSSVGSTALRNHIAEKHSVSAENVVIGAGSKYLSFAVFSALCNPGDEVIVVMPNWLTYISQIEFFGYKTVKFFLDPDLNLDTQELESIIEKCANPRAIVLSTPNNPTGKIFTKKELALLHNIAIKHNIVLISDEVFTAFEFGQDKFVSLVDIVDSYENAVVIRSGSKDQGMSGLRVGYAITSPELVEGVSKVTSLTINNVPEVLQLAYLNELKADAAAEKIQQKYKNKYDTLVAEVNNSKHLELNSGGGGTTVFVKIKTELPYNSKELAKRLLEEKRVHVVSGSAFGVEGYLRLSFTLSEKEIKEGIQKIDQFIEEEYEK